jgi:E3 ubiquitin-protein ligase BRE1
LQVTLTKNEQLQEQIKLVQFVASTTSTTTTDGSNNNNNKKLNGIDSTKLDSPSAATNTNTNTASASTSVPTNHNNKELLPTSASSTTFHLSGEKAEKLHREHRRMKKDLSALTASKEATRAKLERAEKEHASLLKANARLLSQISEKDEINAKSLSSILHLKSFMELLTREHANLEQQTKSASQLALAARLAVNSKERFTNQLVQEKTTLQERVTLLQTNIHESTQELNWKTNEWSDATGKVASLNEQLASALARSNELVSQLEKKNEEMRHVTDQASKAERQAREVAGKLDQEMPTIDKNNSNNMFTADQLHTQISVLKNRLSCPVCHYRDKECIIMRCRHMHCKPCVEERVSNRSRKCPTCNVKFAEKDVEDIWLNG